MNAMTIHTAQGRSELSVSVSGALVVDSSPRLRVLLMDAIQKGSSIAIDLSALRYLDTSGVATLLEAARVASSRGVRVRVTGLAGEPRMLAQIVELDVLFRAYGSEVELA
jgi:anti-sigma B factor antagonist